MLLLEEGAEKTRDVVNQRGERVTQVLGKGADQVEAQAERDRLSDGRDPAMRRMLRYKARYFTDGAVIGSRGFCGWAV